jgi:hypothetical protein
VQWHPPIWMDPVADTHGGLVGPITVRLRDVVRDDDLLSATVDYSLGEQTCSQPFANCPKRMFVPR